MKEEDRQLPNRAFDVIVIGGGITGAWITLDCTLRGLSTLLIEKDDFGGATSMRSSRILHGGIRYLQQLDLPKVKESSQERSFLIESAPHMITQVPFIVPTYSGFRRGGAFLYAGMLAYRLLTRHTQRVITDPANRIPPDRAMSREEILSQSRVNANGLTGGRVLYEAQLKSSERMTFSVIKSAAQHGATAMNYVSADRYFYDAKTVAGVVVTDRTTSKTGTIRSRLVINATGPWCDQLNGKDTLHRLNTGFARGAHMVTRALLGDCAVALPSAFRGDGVATRGNRHIFIIPWRNRSLIGTSYMEASTPANDLTPEPQEIDQLIDTVNEAMPSARLSRKDVLQSFAGYYPLQSDSIKAGVYQGTGEYRLVDHHEIDGVGGLVTALGAKFTTGRRLAEMAAQLAEKKLKGANESQRYTTRGIKLPGGHITNMASFREDAAKKYQARWSRETSMHLVDGYGTEIEDLAALCHRQPDLARPLSPAHDTIGAQIVWAARHEWVVCLSDIVFRRTDLCLLGNPGEDVLKRCAELAGAERGWGAERQAREIAAVRAELEQCTRALWANEDLN